MVFRATFPALEIIILRLHVILLMEKKLHHPTCMKACKYWDIYHIHLVQDFFHQPYFVRGSSERFVLVSFDLKRHWIGPFCGGTLFDWLDQACILGRLQQELQWLVLDSKF